MKQPLFIKSIDIQIIVASNPENPAEVRLEGAVMLDTKEAGGLLTGFVTTPFPADDATRELPMAIEAIGRLVTNPNSEFVPVDKTPKVIRLAPFKLENN